MSDVSRLSRNPLRMNLLAAVLATQSCSAFHVPSNALSHLRRPLKSQPNTIFFAAKESDLVSDFCQGTNAFWKQLVFPQVREKVEIQPAFTAGDGILERLTAAPENPGLPRPVCLTVLGSVPTALGWYGYYKFSVEEELFQHELANEGKVSGCGGYGTLFPFVFGVLAGSTLEVAHIPGGATLVEAAGAWILFGQINLYRRVNELVSRRGPLLSPSLDTAASGSAAAPAPVEVSSLVEGARAGSIALESNSMASSSSSSAAAAAPTPPSPLGEGSDLGEPPLWAWWALLPPPLDVVVGLRQVHFLALYWAAERAELAASQGQPVPPSTLEVDPFAAWFPFIASPRFTLKKFARTPSLWFAFTKDWPDFDIPLLKEE